VLPAAEDEQLVGVEVDDPTGELTGELDVIRR